jgi:hypothetical protein
MKKIIVQTVYFNCDDAWIEDYVERLCANPAIRESKKDLLAGETVGFRSDDPTSKAYGVTTYLIEPQAQGEK